MKGKLLIVLLSLTFLVVLPGLSFAQFGSVSGRVTGEGTGEPIAWAAISLSGIYGVWHTDSSGHYLCDSIPAGAYLASAHAPGYFPETYPESVIVIAGENTPDIDFALTSEGGHEFGSISGRITDEETGLGLPMAHVWAHGHGGTPGGGDTWSDTAGYYLIQNLVAGEYRVGVHKDGYEDEVYPELVTVEGEQNTPDIDFALTPLGGPEFGSISGRVTDEQTGLPIIMATITITGVYGVWHTDTAGYYFCHPVAPGSHQVHALKDGYIPEAYPDSVIVIAGQNTPDIDFALTPLDAYGTISGQITDEETGLPIIMARVVAMGLDSSVHGHAWSDTGGWYAIRHLSPGTYQVVASKEGYAPEEYPDPVTVVAGEVTPNIDFALTPIGEYGSISGMVIDEETGLPISMAHLVAIGLDNWCYAEAWSDSGGYYVIHHMCPGLYQVNAHAQGYVPETLPDSVIVTAGQNTPDIDFALTPEGGPEFGSISGRVTDEQTGLPIIMAEITITGIYGIWHTDTAGYYFCGHLVPGSYEVSARKDGYHPETYPDSVVVVAGENTPDIDFALAPMGEAGSISGTITDANTGEPIPFACVWACGEFGHGQAHTDSLGEYTIPGLQAGSYFVTAWACGYWPQDYPDTVGVIEGQNTPGIDFALVPYGGPGEGIIAGMVVEDTTFLLPISDAIVIALSLNGNWGFDFTDSMGTYMIQGLQTDDYYVFALAPGYVGEFYDGVYSWEEATLVTPDAYGVDFYLWPWGSGEGRISGVISSDGTPLEGVFVYAEAGGVAKGFARSSSDGGYVINGLVPGTYTVYASMVSYHDGVYPDPVQVGYGKVDGINIELPPVQVGDANGNGLIDAGDVVFLVNYLYLNGSPPDPMMTGDLNGDGAVDGADVVYLINYLFRNGPPPWNP